MIITPLGEAWGGLQVESIDKVLHLMAEKLCVLSRYGHGSDAPKFIEGNFTYRFTMRLC